MKALYTTFLYLFCTLILLPSYLFCESTCFFSQKGQDQWVIEEIFQHKENGFFVDLAASNGIELSNTYLLEKKYRWQGICIEPNPHFYKQLTNSRSSINLPYCVDSINQEVCFLISRGMLGGIIDFDTDNCQNYTQPEINYHTKRGNILRFETKTLEQILDENKAPKVIEYLSLDVEGAETRILENFPFNKYTFLAMTIERPTPKLHRIFLQNGYIFVKNQIYDGFYIHKSLPNASKIHREKFIQIPAKRNFFLEHQK